MVYSGGKLIGSGKAALKLNSDSCKTATSNANTLFPHGSCCPWRPHAFRMGSACGCHRDHRREAISNTLADLKSRGYEIIAVALLLSAGRKLPLPQILASHPLIHAAEANFFVKRSVARASHWQFLHLDSVSVNWRIPR